MNAWRYADRKCVVVVAVADVVVVAVVVVIVVAVVVVVATVVWISCFRLLVLVLLSPAIIVMVSWT